MGSLRREEHRVVASVLAALDHALLEQAECYFGGGTQLALRFGEYRVSRDIDFLCSNRAGFRTLRECITQESLGPIAKRPLRLARELRADRDGLRTFISVGDVRIKFEIVLEARIDLSGERDVHLGVPALTLDCAIAEKFLANADRGLDQSVQARDLVDLAFVAAHAGKKGLVSGLAVAQSAYGAAVLRSLRQSIENLKSDRVRRTNWLKSLGVVDVDKFGKGLRVLQGLV